MDNARLLVFEAYCRIHQCIDLRMLAAKLNMDESAAEKWVVNLIRNADLNAKINSQVTAGDFCGLSCQLPAFAAYHARPGRWLYADSL